MKNRFLLVMMGVAAMPICWATGPLTSDGLDIGTGNTVAVGSNSIAGGTNNVALYGSIAIGNGNQTLNSWSSAFGESNIISGPYSSGIGSSNEIDIDSFAAVFLGHGNTAEGVEGAGGIGLGNFLRNESGSFVAGYGNSLEASTDRYGLGNIVLGYGNVIHKDGVGSGGYSVQSSMLIGADNEASDSYAWAFGRGNLAQANTVTLGTYALEVSSASLIVGNGTSGVGRSNGLVVLKNGTVSIPSGTLQLNGESALTSTSAQSVISGHLSTNAYFRREHGTGASATNDSLAAWGWDASASGTRSFAIGSVATASGFESFALGNAAEASGEWSMALGLLTEAPGAYAVAIGSISHATGDYSMALGSNSSALGEKSIALGGQSNGDYSFSAGYGTAGGYVSIAMGTAFASGPCSVAIGGFDEISGQINEAYGVGAAAIGGGGNTAMGDNTFVTGYQTKAAVAGSVAMGSRNLTRGNLLPFLNSTDWNETEALFELGNGNSGASPEEYSNAITTLKNGRTSLTNKFWNSSAPKDVPSNATEASNGEALVVEGHTVLKGNTQLAGKVTLLEAQGDISMGIYGD